jgi:murein DD-endopeptidase MepM/ murein hydrolase activator NlpD
MASFAPPLMAAAAPSPLAPPPAPAPSFTSPVPQARVTSSFGERWNPVKSRQDHHNGVDLAAAEGTPVRAPGAGIVRVATTTYEEGADWGTVVVVDHADGYRTFHAHLGSLSVVPGQRVVQGEELGTVGATGRVTGPHLHFEVHKDGVPVDPNGLLDGC